MGNITQHDRDILRGLAKKQLEISQLPAIKERVSMWRDHNDLHGARPMIHIELGTFEHEIIPERLSCETLEGRSLETELYRSFVNYELFGDDYPVPDFFSLIINPWFLPFGLDVKVEYAQGSHGHRFVHPIKDLAEALPSLGKSTFGYDIERAKERQTLAQDIFGDILPVRPLSGCLYAVPTQCLVHLCGMESMLITMASEPEAFTEVISRLTDDYADYFKWMEREGLILPTNCFSKVGQGTWGFTEALDGLSDSTPPEPTVIENSWGFLDSQETVGVSPDMYSELVFPHYKKLADMYGLLSYGCCEPVHPIWEKCLKNLANLRKLSVSPWCDEEYIGEQLAGRGVIYHRKPSPNYLGTSGALDEEAFTAHIIKTLCAAKGCTLEITFRDIYTVGGDEAKVRRGIELVREAVCRYW